MLHHHVHGSAVAAASVVCSWELLFHEHYSSSSLRYGFYLGGAALHDYMCLSAFLLSVQTMGASASLYSLALPGRVTERGLTD